MSGLEFPDISIRRGTLPELHSMRGVPELAEPLTPSVIAAVATAKP